MKTRIPKQAFFQKFAAAFQRLLYDEPEERGIPPAVLEVSRFKQTLHLTSDLVLLFFSFWDPRSVYVHTAQQCMPALTLLTTALYLFLPAGKSP